MRFSLLIIVIFISTSCIQEIELRDDGLSRHSIIVNGVLYSDSIANIFINKSNQYTRDYSPEFLTDAIVTLYYSKSSNRNEIFFEERLQLFDSVYVGRYKMVDGDHIWLDVLTYDGKRLESQTYIPSKHEVKSSRLKYPSGFRNFDGHTGPYGTFSLEMGIQNSIGGYYECFVVGIDNSFLGCKKNEHVLPLLTNRDQVILAEGLPSENLTSFIFTAKTPEEFPSLLSFDANINPFLRNYYFVFQSVTKEYYLYKKTLYSHLNALELESEVTVSTFFGQGIFRPIEPVYSNIIGGRGIFAGISTSQIEFECVGIENAVCN